MSYYIYIVSLKDETERRNSIKSKLGKLIKKASFIDAVDLRKLEEKEIEKLYDKTFAEQLYKRKLTNGEVGCSLSHRKVFEKIVSQNDFEHTLILEDDANFECNEINKILKSPELQKQNWDVILLGYSKLAPNKEKMFYLMEPVKKTFSINNIFFGPSYHNWTSGTVAYIIKKDAAQKILDYPHLTLADDWNTFEKEIGLNILHCRPTIVSELFQTFESSLETERKVATKKQRSILDPVRVLRGVYRRIILHFR